MAAKEGKGGASVEVKKVDCTEDIELMDGEELSQADRRHSHSALALASWRNATLSLLPEPLAGWSGCKTVLLLYLNKQTFHDNDGTVAQVVKRAMGLKIKLCLRHS